jgi:hypothetical protein
MGRDNQPKHRQQLRDISRKSAKRQAYESVLIVTEGVTEAIYLNEIRTQCRLSSTNVVALPSADGTEPIQIVEYANTLFLEGSTDKGIRPQAFDSVYMVFDRDEHKSYHDALAKIKTLNNMYENFEGEPVSFYAAASVPCFEVWLLMHYQDVNAPVHRRDVYKKLKEHLPTYDKGQSGWWHQTKHNFAEATSRAEVRSKLATVYDGNEPFTSIHKLVSKLLNLMQPV